MSTAYPPRFIRYMLSSQKERDVAKSSAIAPREYGDFPPTFGLYYEEPGNDYLSQRFNLSLVDSAGQAKNILYTLTFHKGPGQRQMTLYSGPDAETPLAVGSNEKRFSSSAVIKLPGPASGKEWTERLRYLGVGSNAYTFEYGGEVYEWREDSMSRPRTRRLRKKASAVCASNSESGNLLATWIEGSVPNRSRQLAVFRLGDGDTTGLENLDERWMLLAVSTALVICQQGAAVEGTMTWHEEKMLEKGAYQKS